jgi:transcription elongation factor GreA-like protein
MSLFDYSLGDFVTHSERPDWGVGQVQSIEGTRITVNFEHVGKQLINAERILLIPVAAEIE